MNSQVFNYYLTQVLGVRWLIGANAKVATQIATEAHAQLAADDRPLAVLTPFALNEVELEFIKKMLSAVSSKEPLLISSHEHDSKMQIQLLLDHGTQFLICFGIQPPKNVESLPKTLNFSSISDFLDHSDEQKLVALKRAAWNELKQVKAALQE